MIPLAVMMIFNGYHSVQTKINTITINIKNKPYNHQKFDEKVHPRIHHNDPMIVKIPLGV